MMAKGKKQKGAVGVLVATITTGSGSITTKRSARVAI
jgi:hypothetical protein